MKETQWTRLLVVVVLVLVAAPPGALSSCPALAGTSGIFTATISFTVDTFDDICTASPAGSDTQTSFTRGETKSIAGLGNDCLKFTFGNYAGFYYSLFLDQSSCAYESGCMSDVINSTTTSTCSELYSCVCGVSRKTERTWDDWYQFITAKVSVFSGYTCGQTGSGPCAEDECFVSFADPLNGPVCVAKGDNYITEDYSRYTCEEFTTCDSSATYVDLVYVEKGCNNEGTYVSPGEVTWSDACRQTVCDVNGDKAELVTSFIGEEGCVYDDQCVAVGQTIAGHGLYTCGDFTCRKNKKVKPADFYLDIVDTGCYVNGSCYADKDQVDTDEACKKLRCKYDSDKKEYLWKNVFTGCYDFTNGTCAYANKQSYELDGCIKNQCITIDNAKWETTYKSSCAPDKKKCKKNGIPGCKHDGQCYQVKSVLEWDDCVQYVCHNEDAGLNNGTYAQGVPLPEWKARAIGCYGPKGCMKFGEQFVDPMSKNLYRCTYELGDLGIKYAEFHKSCVAPNGTTLALRQSVLLGHLWYSCYRGSVLRVPIDRTAEPTTTFTCGNNPDVGGKLYTKLWYWSEEGKCKRSGTYCTLKCLYFDEPCTNRSDMPAYQFRHLGDNFTLDGAECLCTQNKAINNRPVPVSGSNSPSLCAEHGVWGGACKDPDDGTILRQWGQFWERSNTNPLQVCTCHPMKRKAFCSTFLPDVVDALIDMKY